MKELKLAVIGKDVSKSLSPQIHNFIADKLGYKIDYRKISIPEDMFEEAIDGIISDLDGFNVTIPYKLSIMSRLKKIEGDAKVFGAVNTVKCSDLSSNNTDGAGFWLMLKNNGIEVAEREVLLLGAGGAGRSVAKKLADAGAKVYLYDRKFENAFSVQTEFDGVTALENLIAKPYFAIVNATGVGMHKTVGVSPVDESLLMNCEVAVDLIYEPEKSKFLQIAESFDKKILNGEAMLFYQAYYSECIYLGITPDEDVAKRLFEEFKNA